MSNKQPILVLIDGHALAYRAYFGMPATFSTSAGEPTHAVYGFLNMILAVWKEVEPDYFIVTFDRGDTFRHQMYEEYKANRKAMPDDLRPQIGDIHRMLAALGVPALQIEGYEADDILAMKQYPGDGHRAVRVHCPDAAIRAVIHRAIINRSIISNHRR